MHSDAGGKQAWPLVAHCSSLTQLRLRCLPAFAERLPEGCHNLQELQLTYAYAEHPVPGEELLWTRSYERTGSFGWVCTHPCATLS